MGRKTEDGRGTCGLQRLVSSRHQKRDLPLFSLPRSLSYFFLHLMEEARKRGEKKKVKRGKSRKRESGRWNVRAPSKRQFSSKARRSAVADGERWARRSIVNASRFQKRNAAVKDSLMLPRSKARSGVPNFYLQHILASSFPLDPQEDAGKEREE